MKSITERWTTALAWPLGGCPMPTGSKVSLVVNQLAGVVCCLGDGMADQCVNKVDWPEQFGIVGVYYIETTVCTLYLDLYIYIYTHVMYIYIYIYTQIHYLLIHHFEILCPCWCGLGPQSVVCTMSLAVLA